MPDTEQGEVRHATFDGGQGFLVARHRVPRAWTAAAGWCGGARETRAPGQRKEGSTNARSLSHSTSLMVRMTGLAGGASRGKRDSGGRKPARPVMKLGSLVLPSPFEFARDQNDKIPLVS